MANTRTQRETQVAPALLKDHLPPQNLEAEESVLGALLLEKNAILKIAPLLTGDDFYRDHYGIMYSGMLALFEKRVPIDLITLAEELERTKQLQQVGGPDAVAALVAKVPSAAHIVHYANIVKEKAILRRLITAANRIIQVSFDQTIDAPQALDLSEQALFSVSQKFFDKSFAPINELLADSFERIDLLRNQSIPGFAFSGEQVVIDRVRGLVIFQFAQRMRRRHNHRDFLIRQCLFQLPD